MKVTAKKNHVSGWVRNLKDGRVEAILEGEDVNVSSVVEWCHAGPANARVEDIEIKNEKYKGEFTKFEVLY
jgi:acylphosphatase